MLPPLIHVDVWRAGATDWLQSTLRLIASEASQLGPGAEIIITRIADVLVIQAIRDWLQHASMPEQSWIAAFNNEQIGRALALIHKTPAASDDTVANVAHGLGYQSEATFSRAYKRGHGVSPGSDRHTLTDQPLPTSSPAA